MRVSRNQLYYMKLRLPLSLKSALCALAAGAATLNTQAATSETDIGQWMLIGDSISHGTFNCTYRWNIQQVFIDNGISYDAVGPLSGGYFDGYETASYGGKSFDNQHAAQYNIYGSEISGKELGMGLSGDYEWGHVDPPYVEDNGDRATSMLGSNVKNWLDQGNSLTTARTDLDEELGMVTVDKPLVINGKECSTYEEAWAAGNRGTAPTFKPDTVTIMMGTNDRKNPGFLDLDPRWQSYPYDEVNGKVNESILENVGSVVKTVFAANDQADVYIMTMPYTNPVVGGGIDRLPLDISMGYNEALTTWVEDYNTNAQAKGSKGIHLVDVNRGMLDVTKVEVAGVDVGGAADGMMADWTHMSTQGNLIVAGNLAKGMGYAGRTAGLERSSAASWATGTYNGTGTQSYLWGEDANLAHGYTVEFNLKLGNGKVDGWDTTNNVSISVGDGVHYGTLSINEAFIKWGDTILYSRDASETGDNLRIAYVVGEQEMNLAQGYYIWMGDQLIGEACEASWGTDYQTGITISSATGIANVNLTNLAWDSSKAWAPTAPGNLVSNTDAGFKAYTVGDGYDRSNKAEGVQGFKDANALGLTTSDNNFKRLMSGNRTRMYGEGEEAVTVHYANFKGDAAAFDKIQYVGLDGDSHDVDVNNTVWQFGEGDAAGCLAAFGEEDRTANISVRIFDQSPGFKAVYGLYDNQAANHTLTGDVLVQLDAKGAVYGSYQGAENMSATGSATLVLNSGQVKGDVVGGFSAAAEGQSLGSTAVYINNDAVVMGNVYGGSKVDSGTIRDNALVVVTGGKVKGNIYGNGATDTVGGTSEVRITGGEIGSGEGTGNIFADEVTVESNKAYIHGNITADTVVLKNIEDGKDTYGFDKYANHITAKQSLTLENVTAEKLAAIIDTDELVVKGNTKTSLTAGDSRIGKVSIEDGSSIGMTLQAGSKLSVGDLKLSEGSVTELDSTTASLVTVAVTGTLSVEQGAGVSGNVEMMTGSTLAFSSTDGLNVTGSVTLHAGISLSSAMLAAAEGLGEGDYITLFTGATEMLLRGRSDVRMMMLAGFSADTLDLVTDADAADYFNNLAKGEYTVAFSHNTEGVGLVTLQKGTPLTSVPEPASGTLSLLALVALAARRRRKG